MTTEQETKLGDALSAAYPAVEVSDTLRRRVAALAGSASSARQLRHPGRRRAVLRLAVVAVTVAAVVAFSLFPRLNAVQAFQRMTDSLKDVRSTHYVTWTVLPNGGRVKLSEVWYQAGKWRIETTEPEYRRVQVVRDGLRWTYYTNSNTVTQDLATSLSGQLELDSVSGFSVGALLRDGAIHGYQNHVTLLGETAVAGRPAHVILFYSQRLYDKPYDEQQQTWRSRITVDNASDLPIRSEDQSRKTAVDEWQTTQITENQYNFTMPATVFTAVFPKTARLFDVAAGREEWRQRLGKGIAKQRVIVDGEARVRAEAEVALARNNRGRPTTVVIRDFQVNAKGDVFLLFTANTKAGRDLTFENLGSAELTDEFGTKYLDPSHQKSCGGQQGFVPTCMDTAPSGLAVNGYVFDGEQLEGARWVPLQQQTPWKPRHFKLTLHVASSTDDGESGTAVFDLPVQKADCEVVPEYMPYMARRISGDANSQAQNEAGLRAYYLQHVQRDLPQALGVYRELIALRVEKQKVLKAPSPANADEWFAVYQILNEMGHSEEAKSALLRAKQDDRYPWDHTIPSQIREAMKKLGLNT